MAIELNIRNYYPMKDRKLNYFPIIHISYEKYNSFTKLPKLEFGIIGFCLTISIVKIFGKL